MRTPSALARLLVVALLGGGMVGCGLPEESTVEVRGPKPSQDPASGDGATRQVKRANASQDPAKFARSYLEAAAGKADGTIERVKDFIAPGDRAGWKPSAEVNVVRLTEEPLVTPGSSAVVLRVQQLGVLNGNGTMEAPSAQETSYTLTVGVEEGESGLFVINPPPVLLLSAEALEDNYNQRTLYFWNTEHTTLVPDLRYLPDAIPPELQPTEILDWLSLGPSSLLSKTADGLPSGTTQIGNVPSVDDDGLLEVNLTAGSPPPDEAALKRLGAQLFWSLRPNFTGELELKIEGQLRARFNAEDEVLASNPGYELSSPAERFCVYAGQVMRMTSSANPGAGIPVLTKEVNKDVRTAAFARYGGLTYAAVVAGKDKRQLVVGVGPTAAGGVANAFLRTDLPSGATSRPVWLWSGGSAEGSQASTVGLIAVKGRLMRFGVQDGSMTELSLLGIPGKVTAVAAAHDGHRIAVVAGGRLYVAPLIRSDSNVKLGTPREVRTSLRQIAAADWTGEEMLVLAGTRSDNGRVAIFSTTIDGAIESERVGDLGEAQVTHLAAYPASPLSDNDASRIAYVANNEAYDLFADPLRIEPIQLVGVPAGAEASKIAAPFFLD